MYDDGGSLGGYSAPSKVDAKLRLINVEMVLKPNSIYERLNRLWINATHATGLLGYYDANIYDGLWVLSLSTIRANSTEPLDIENVLTTVASEYVGATGRCTLEERGSRMGADYNIFAYVEVDGTIKSLLCGSYGWESDEFIWKGPVGLKKPLIPN